MNSHECHEHIRFLSLAITTANSDEFNKKLWYFKSELHQLRHHTTKTCHANEGGTIFLFNLF